MKKYIALFLTLVMLASVLVGCGNSDKPESEDPTTAPTSPSAPTTPYTPIAPTTAPTTPPTQATEPSEEETEPSIAPTTPPTTAPEEPNTVFLHTMPVYGDKPTYQEGEKKNSYGDTFSGHIYELVAYGKGSENNKYITVDTASFTLDGAYNYLTGTFFTRSNQNEDYTIELLVYADDELIYCSEPISRKTRSVDLAVDISGCQMLTIAARSYDYSLTSTKPGIYLVNPELHKEYDGALTPGVEINPNLVSLTDLYIYSNSAEIVAGTVKDSYGNSYKGIYMDLCSYTDYNDYTHWDYTEFVNDGYRYLSGTFFTRHNQNADFEVEFLIYADDELVYSSGTMKRNSKAVDFVVEIGDCDLIKVMSRSSDHTLTGTDPGIILVDAFVSVEEP